VGVGCSKKGILRSRRLAWLHPCWSAARSTRGPSTSSKTRASCDRLRNGRRPTSTPKASRSFNATGRLRRRSAQAHDRHPDRHRDRAPRLWGLANAAIADRRRRSRPRRVSLPARFETQVAVWRCIPAHGGCVPITLLRARTGIRRNRPGSWLRARVLVPASTGIELDVEYASLDCLPGEPPRLTKKPVERYRPYPSPGKES
jgi:hypothetical protein